MKKIGILGGTFNPIHNGHIAIAKAAVRQYELDEIWLMPTGDSPHKEVADQVSRLDRLRMTAIAAKSIPGAKVCTWETERSQKSYSYITLRRFTAAMPDAAFYFIIGQDSLETFSDWVHPEIISHCATILAAPRGGDDGKTAEEAAAQMEPYFQDLRSRYAGSFEAIDTRARRVSSTEIREAVRSGQPVIHLTDHDVATYIKEHHLYETPASYDFPVMQKKLEDKLKPARYLHSLGVMDTCCALAARWQYPVETARCAGLLHDCAKYMSNAKMLEFAQKKRIDITPAEIASPHLIHAKLGAYLAEQEYGITDPEILQAIRVHTTGNPVMGLLDKILFVADYIEPNRAKAPRLNEIRQIAFWDLELACMMILEDTIAYLKENNSAIDLTTEETRVYFADRMESRSMKQEIGFYKE